jgi:hydrogenase maturation protein HypF
LFDTGERRHRFPFISCSRCGPRYTIHRSGSFTRENTTFSAFPMCDRCREEYADASGSQSGNETIACPECGPTLVARDPGGKVMCTGLDALDATVRCLREGRVVAVKDLGGYALYAAARDEEVVRRLRRLDERPLAVVFPSIAPIEAMCELSTPEREALTSTAAPIVLLRYKQGGEGDLAAALSDDGNLPYAAVALASTALRCLLLAEAGAPLAVRCGAECGDPVLADDLHALARFGGSVALLLGHDLEIAHPMVDSVVQVVSGKLRTLRNGRGHAPVRVSLDGGDGPPDLLAVGGQRSSAIAVSGSGQAILGQHLGDLDALPVYETLRAAIDPLSELCRARPGGLIRDLHPDYLSSRYAEAGTLPVRTCQHHLAHVLSCVGEHGITGPVLGVAWDGNGFGPDETMWGGEFLRVEDDTWRRAAYFRPFRLPGGETAILEPRRAALGVLYEFLGHKMFGVDWLNPMKACTKRELQILSTMLCREFNTPRTSSVSRLIDAVASLSGLRQVATYPGQTSLELEAARKELPDHPRYEFRLDSREGRPSIVDWEPTVRAIVRDVNRSVSTGRVSTKFHNTLVEIVVEVAKRVGERTIVLAGDTFENRFLTERTTARLEQEGFEVHVNRTVPTNDGGIALGQVVWGRRCSAHEARDA